jgi:hypothetical protein
LQELAGLRKIRERPPFVFADLVVFFISICEMDGTEYFDEKNDEFEEFNEEWIPEQIVRKKTAKVLFLFFFCCSFGRF